MDKAQRDSPEKQRQAREKDRSQQVEHMQVPNGKWPGVQRSKLPLLACHTRRKCSMETSKIGIKFDQWRVVIVFGHATECPLAFMRVKLHFI